MRSGFASAATDITGLVQCLVGHRYGGRKIESGEYLAPANVRINVTQLRIYDLLLLDYSECAKIFFLDEKRPDSIARQPGSFVDNKTLERGNVFP